MARVLLDTHAFLWWLDGDKSLSPKARSMIQTDETEVLVSAASVWEITTKARIGKLPGALEVAADVPGCIASQGFRPLPITVEHAQRAGGLPGPHRDPFDRLLIAQAHTERVPLISVDSVFDSYGVTRLWK
jgi:PIN domain nuclease of toxin-antitoxin system